MILPGVGQGVDYLLIIRKMTVKKKRKKEQADKENNPGLIQTQRLSPRRGKTPE